MSEANQRFDSFQQWVNKARSWLTRHPRYGTYFRALCVDTKGRICRNGADFMRADKEGAFPVRWWWPDQPIEELASVAVPPPVPTERDIVEQIKAWS